MQELKGKFGGYFAVRSGKRCSLTHRVPRSPLDFSCNLFLTGSCTAVLLAWLCSPHNFAAAACSDGNCGEGGDTKKTDAATLKAKRMHTLDIDTWKKQFNQSSDNVRVVALLSPNCPVCRHGGDVVRDIFKAIPSSRLNGFTAWIPMYPRDTAQAAAVQSRSLQDLRIVQGWDADKKLGKLFAKTLKLRVPAWDVYLAYAPGVIWDADLPPVPTFWRHQLEKRNGADQSLCLDPDKLSREVLRLVGAVDARE